MRDSQKYPDCCRSYQGCRQHFPPGICTTLPQINTNTESARQAPKPRFSVIHLLSSLVAKSVAARKTPHVDMPSCVLSLPIELLQLVASYLPLVSRAVFALSSKYICHAIGHESWRELRRPERRGVKIDFLVLLGKDSKDHWFCGNCAILHPRAFDRRNYYEKYDGSTYPFDYQLPSRLVKLAIERQQKGPPHGICPDRLSCAGIFKKDGMRWDYAYRVRVVGGELILRMDVRVIPFCLSTTLACLHYRPTPTREGRTFIQKVLTRSRPARHYRADYPYAPQDSSMENIKEPNRELLKDLFPEVSSNGRSFWRSLIYCNYCVCVTKAVPGKPSDNEGRERLARSYQNVGSCTGDDVKWTRSITPASRLSIDSRKGYILEGYSRLAFENGVPPP